MKMEERAARRKNKAKLRKLDPDDVVIAPAHYGAYTD
jgi:hypothetical protein